MKRPSVGTVAAGLAVAGSYAVVRAGVLEPIEVRVAGARRRGGRRVDSGMAHLTDLGSVYGLAGTVAVLAATGRPRLASDLAGGGGIAWVAGQAMKPMLRRPRPFESGTPRIVAIPAGTSWPSGHSSVAAAMGATIASRSPRAAVLGAGLAFFVGGSRLHVGVHHATDVVAGWGVGVLAANLWRHVASRRSVSRR